MRFFVLLLSFCALLSCSSQKNEKYIFSGKTMGTNYHITLYGKLTENDHDLLKTGLQSQLDNIENLMSSYKPDSQLMQLNRWDSKEDFEIDLHTYTVLKEAKNIYEQSNGAFDISLSPLIELWGFASKEVSSNLPDKLAISNSLKLLDMPSLKLQSKPCVDGRKANCYYASKNNPKISLNVSAIAKGYAVDVLANYLKTYHQNNFLVEVGGEVFASGMKSKQQAWRLGLEKPDMPPGSVQAAVKLTDVAIATSGDYRNFYMRDGQRYSHTLDPRTGYPIKHHLASVSVIAKNTMQADAWATALNVQGLEEAYQTAIKHQLPAYFIQREKDRFVVRYTPLFEQYLEKK